MTIRNAISVEEHNTAGEIRTLCVRRRFRTPPLEDASSVDGTVASRIRPLFARPLFHDSLVREDGDADLAVIGNANSTWEESQKAYKRLLSRHRAQADRLRAQMWAARTERHSFLKLQGRYQRSFSVRLVHAAEQNARVAPRFRRAPHQVVILAASMNISTPSSEPVRIKEKRKPNGAVRYIHQFGVEGRARQSIARSSAEPLAEFHPAQFDVAGRGGLHGLMRAAKADIDMFGFTWAIELDVRTAFQSVAEAACLEPHVRQVAPEILRHTILTETETYEHTSKITDIITRLTTGAAQIRSGLPTGALSSSLFFAIIVGRVLRQVEQRANVRVYSIADNLLVLATNRRAAEETAMTIGAAFQREPTGRFGLHVKPTRRLDWGFEFLGHHLKRQHGQVHIRPGKKGMSQFARRIQIAALLGIADPSCVQAAVQEQVAFFKAAFRECTDIDWLAAGHADWIVAGILNALSPNVCIPYRSLLLDLLDQRLSRGPSSGRRPSTS